MIAIYVEPRCFPEFSSLCDGNTQHVSFFAREIQKIGIIILIDEIDSFEVIFR